MPTEKMCVIFGLHIQMFTLCMLSAHVGQKVASDFLKIELQSVVICM